MKRLLLFSIVLFAIWNNAVATFSSVAPSGQTLYYNIVDGNAEVTYQILDYYGPRYSDLSGSLIIPSTVTYGSRIYSVTSIGDAAFSRCESLTSVIIPSSVTSIGGSAFSGCTGLISVSIGSSVTSIGSYAFYECSSLTGSLTISDSVITIGEEAFYHCSGLTSVTIGESVASIGDKAFNYCVGLTTVNFNATNCTTMGGNSTAYACFLNCPSLSTLNIGENVLTLPSFAFYGCSELSGSLTIPNSVTSIGANAFYNCSGLTAVTIGNAVTSIGGWAFYECSGLSGTLSIPNTVTSIGSYAFKGCCNLTNITVEGGNTVYDSRNNCNAIIETSSNKLIAGCMNTTIPNSVVSIAMYAFYNCSGLSSITIPNSITFIGHSAFYNCTGLAGSLVIPNSVTYIDYDAFNGCTGLTGSLIIPNSVIEIGYHAFYNCSGLTTLSIGTSVTELNGAFVGCSALTSITVADGNTAYDSRDNCNAIISTTYNKLITGCMNTTIPNTVTGVCAYAFYNCGELTSITIPSTVTFIGEYAFYNCSGLATMNFNAINCSSIENSSGYVYYGCTSLVTLNIGDSVQTLPNNAFRGCSSLTEIHSRNRIVPTLGNYVFAAVPSTIPVYVPCGCIYYAAADGWSQFTNFIEESGIVLSAISDNNQMGSVQILAMPTCSSPQAAVYAAANNGYQFNHWSDGSTANPYSLNVYNDLELVAYFSPNGGGDQPSDNAPSIACVGVDMTNHNVVRWEPRQGVSVVRYNIYREGLGGYSQVGYVNATNATEYSWVDDNSNTATQAYSYKLSEVAANGTESDLSTPHTTMHLQISQGQGTTWNLSWTPYVGFNYSGYRIYRGTSSASMSLLTELSSSATTYSDNNAPSGNVYYQIEVVASSAKSITASSRSNIATSVQNQQFTVTVLSDNSSMGTVSGGGTFAQGATTTITATPLSGYTFTQWSDGSTQAQRTITVTGNATYTAYFTAGGSEPQQYLITVVSNNPERGTVTGGGLYDAGAMITITAEPFAGYEFVQWHDGNTNDFRAITVTADATYTAYFRTATEGINDVEAADNIKIYTRGNRIVIDFSGQQAADGRQSVVVYDVMGRVIKQTADSGQQAVVEIPVTSAGVYMVKVGEWPSRKVLVRQ